MYVLHIAFNRDKHSSELLGKNHYRSECGVDSWSVYGLEDCGTFVSPCC